MKGVVKFFNDAKGYGFIINDETKEEVFVHFTGINMEGHKTLVADQHVTYEVEKDPKTNKDRAVHVTVD